MANPIQTARNLLKKKLEPINQVFSTAGQNLSDWYKVATQPQLRQSYSQNVIKPYLQARSPSYALNAPAATTTEGFFPTKSAKFTPQEELVPLKEFFKPKSYLGGKAGKALASSAEAALPAIWPTMGGGAGKLALNIPQMLKSGAGFASYTALMNALQGKKQNVGELAGSFAMGVAFGLVGGGVQPEGGTKAILQAEKAGTYALKTPKIKIKATKGVGGVVAEATEKTLGKIKLRNLKAEEQLAKQNYREWQSNLFRQEGVKTTTGKIKTITTGIKEKTISPLSKDIEGMRDISSFQGGMRDVFRNFKQVFGKNFGVAKQIVLDPFDKAKGQFIDDQQLWLGKLDKDIVKNLGIKRGSKLSELTQRFGEKQIDQKTLQRLAPKDWQKVIKADQWFRQAYDQILNEVNATRAKIYPNDPSKIITRRQDYYRHFRELAQGFQGLKNIADTPAHIASSLSGISEFTKPKSKWLSFAQKRLGVATDVDAVGGFLNYLKGSSYAKNIDPQISRFRNLANELAEATAPGTKQAGKLNNFIEFLNDFSNDLAGKTNPIDRTFQKWIPGGRKAFRAISWLNSRVKANVILANASASLAQIFNVPQGMAEAGPKSAIKGLGRSLASIFVKNKPMGKSTFIKERYFNSYDKFDVGMLKYPKRFAIWMVQVLDEVGTKYIWNSIYDKGLSSGMSNPGKYADDITRKMVAGRGIGEVALAQKAKVFQMIAPFQVEVGNLWWVMKDWVSAKEFGKLVAFSVYSYLFNRGAEKVRGSGVSLDPINAMVDAINAFKEEENKGIGAIRAGGRMVGEVLSNIPVGQTLAAVYPEYGLTIPGTGEKLTRKEFFGREDPTRFGGGALFTKGLQDPLYKLIPPFGGQQIKRTIAGIQSFKEGTSLTPTGRKRYDIPQTIGNAIKSATLGEYSLPQARVYFENQGKSESETIYREFKKLKTNEEKATLWDQMVKEGRINKDNISNIKKEFKDKTMKISSREETARSLPVKDGSRALAIKKQFDKLKTKEEKSALWKRYVELKIITPEVAKQLKELLKGSL